MTDITVTWKEKGQPDRTALVLASDPTLSLDSIVALLVEHWKLPVERSNSPIGYELRLNQNLIKPLLTLAGIKDQYASFQLQAVPDSLVIADFSQNLGLKAFDVECPSKGSGIQVTLVVEPENMPLSEIQARLENWWNLSSVADKEPVYYDLELKGEVLPSERLVCEIDLGSENRLQFTQKFGIKLLSVDAYDEQGQDEDQSGLDQSLEEEEATGDDLVSLLEEAEPAADRPKGQIAADTPAREHERPLRPARSVHRELTYLDFDVEVTARGSEGYEIHVINSPAGQASEAVTFPFKPSELETRLDKLQIALLRSGAGRRRAPSEEEKVLLGFGVGLFNFMFHGEIRTRYDVSLAQARMEEKGLRLRLRIQAPELAVLPWEYMHDDRKRQYICLSSFTPLVRYPEVPQPIQPLSVRLPLQILGIIAGPRDLAPLDIEREKQRMNQALGTLVDGGLLQVTWLENPTWRELQEWMLRGPWHIIHFIGHGGYDEREKEGFICLVDEGGRADYFMASHLGQILGDHPGLRLVLLNSCEGARSDQLDIFSSTATVLIQCGIPSVLAMQSEISDLAAIELSHTFYTYLAYGMGIETATTQARAAILFSQRNSLEWGTPVLYLRAPTGQLFNLKSGKPA